MAAEMSNENRIVTQLKLSTQSEEIIVLDTGEQEVFALYREERSGNIQGGLILLHDLDGHPDWPGVIFSLRHQMPEYGWSTLSLQLPLTAVKKQIIQYKSLLDEAPARIQAAVTYLQNKQIQNIVLIGHGLGAVMAADYMGNKKGDSINAAILIGMGSLKGLDARLESPRLLEKVQQPMLDLYGSRDQGHVINSARQRTRAAQKAARTAVASRYQRSGFARTSSRSSNTGHIAYRQIQIEGADHNFIGQEEVLIKRVRGWLKRHAAGTRVSAQ